MLSSSSWCASLPPPVSARGLCAHHRLCSQIAGWDVHINELEEEIASLIDVLSDHGQGAKVKQFFEDQMRPIVEVAAEDDAEKTFYSAVTKMLDAVRPVERTYGSVSERGLFKRRREEADNGEEGEDEGFAFGACSFITGQGRSCRQQTEEASQQLYAGLPRIAQRGVVPEMKQIEEELFSLHETSCVSVPIAKSDAAGSDI